MKLVAVVKLVLDTEQKLSLKKTIETANSACNFISEYAWENKVFGQYAIQKAIYHSVKKQFNLTAQVVVRCISKVADAYKLNKVIKRTFKSFGAISYDARILAWKINQHYISIWSINGRLKKIPYICSKRQSELLKFQQGESDLFTDEKEFYLAATCNIEEPDPRDFKDILGIDLGIKNIATTSDGKKFSGRHINNLRHRHRRLRKKLQKKGTKSAKRLLKKRKRKESRFSKDVNHQISKQIVQTAKDTNRAIALENLKGIRLRTTVRKAQRAEHNSWGFFQLRSFIEYKAKREGIQVLLIDPKHTSQTCPKCGCVSKKNRKTQAEFQCIECGFSGHADIVAANNIRRVAVNQPYEGEHCA